MIDDFDRFIAGLPLRLPIQVVAATMRRFADMYTASNTQRHAARCAGNAQFALQIDHSQQLLTGSANTANAPSPVTFTMVPSYHVLPAFLTAFSSGA